MSLSVLSDEYFCNYKGGSIGTSTGVVIFERNQDGIKENVFLMTKKKTRTTNSTSLLLNE